MADRRVKESSDRRQTDGALRDERERTDLALRQRQDATEADADTVIERARENADAVLTAARDKADERLADTQPSPAARAIVTEERLAEDAAVEQERATADATLLREREETARALAALLPLEREKTDLHLLTERVRWDQAVGNRDDFLGIVSHDLRGLLGGIVLSAELLAMKAAQDTRGENATLQATRIQRYAALMNRLIGDLVDVASIEAGRLAVTPAAGDAAAVLDQVADTFEAAARARGMTLATAVAARPLLAMFDGARLLQVMANLVSNALKFTPDGGRIVVAGERTDGAVRLSVTDSGSGIPPDQLEAVFDRFCQVQAGDRRGLGLGLYISRCIVDAQGGRIWAESAPGTGTTVHLALPAGHS